MKSHAPFPLKLTPKVLIPENGELPSQVQHRGVERMYPGVDTVQLDGLDVVNELSLGRHGDVEAVHAAPQARHVFVQAQFDFFQVVCEGVQAAAEPLQLGEPSVQAVAGPPTLPHLHRVVVPDYLDLSAQVVEPDVGIFDVLRQLILQVLHLEEKTQSCLFVFQIVASCCGPSPRFILLRHRTHFVLSRVVLFVCSASKLSR